MEPSFFNALLLAFGTLFAIVNPLSMSLVFTKLTLGMDAQAVKRTALKASIAAFLTLSIFMFLGNYILDFFGITIYAFRVAGGVYLSIIGFEMLSPQLRKSAKHYEDDRDSIAIIPLAIPLLAGPGALTSVLVLQAEYAILPTLLGVLALALVTWIILHHANYIQRGLGKTGSVVVERIMGLIVLVIAVQFVFNGITGYLLTL